MFNGTDRIVLHTPTFRTRILKPIEFSESVWRIFILIAIPVLEVYVIQFGKDWLIKRETGGLYQSSGSSSHNQIVKVSRTLVKGEHKASFGLLHNANRPDRVTCDTELGPQVRGNS